MSSPIITVNVAAQSGSTLSAKLTSAYALCPAPPGQLFVVIDASIPKHTNETLPTPPANCTLIDYRTINEQPSNTRMGQAILDFGSAAEGDTATVTVLASWVQSTSIIICQVGAVTTADHDGEDPVVEAIQARAINIVPGVSFDIEAYAPSGTWGQYVVIYQGLISRSSS